MESVGSKEIPISLAVIAPLLNKLSVTVGMREPVAGDRVPEIAASATCES